MVRFVVGFLWEKNSKKYFLFFSSCRAPQRTAHSMIFQEKFMAWGRDPVHHVVERMLVGVI